MNRESGIGDRESGDVRETGSGKRETDGSDDASIRDSRGSIPGTLNRRQAISAAAAALALPALDWTDVQVDRAARLVRQAAPVAGQAPKFFTAHEWDTVRVLVDYVIPKDERSGSATEAQVPEFIDHMLSDPEASVASQIAMRGGLAWLDTESRRRFGTEFIAATDGDRKSILDDIAWPNRARPEMSHGVAFFNRFRDLTASGFFSSAMGYQDLDFRGNTFVAEWTGCPPDALAKLGVKYD